MLIWVCLLQPVCSYCNRACKEIRILDYSWSYQEYYFPPSLGAMWVAVNVLLVSIFLFLFILAAWHSMGTSSMWQNTWSAVAYTASTSVLGQLPASSSYTTLQYNYSGLNCDTQKMVVNDHKPVRRIFCENFTDLLLFQMTFFIHKILCTKKLKKQEWIMVKPI